MKKISAVIVIILIAAWQGFAAFEDWQVGARANGMAGAYTAVCSDLDAVRWNPAGLKSLEGWQASVYAKRLWGIAGLMNETFSVGKSLGQWGGVAISAQQVGCDLETDQALTLSHGMQLTEQLSFGYNINAYRLWQNRFGSVMTAGVDVGLLAVVYRKWRVGCFGHNLNHPSLGTETQYDLPSGLSIGMAYQPLPGLLASADASKEPGYVTRYKFGAEFELKPRILNIRGGVFNEGRLTMYSAGLDATVQGFTVGYAYEGGHEALNGNHQIGLVYRW
jgi:hypothetical protein